MRTAAHVASLAALIALGLAIGRWLRDPTIGGFVFLLLIAGLAGALMRWLHRPRRPARAREPRAPQPEPLRDHRVDLNRGSLEELQRLPGVGPVAAQRIVTDREANGPFESVEALERVPGFGPAKVRVIAPDARV